MEASLSIQRTTTAPPAPPLSLARSISCATPSCYAAEALNATPSCDVADALKALEEGEEYPPYFERKNKHKLQFAPPGTNVVDILNLPANVEPEETIVCVVMSVRITGPISFFLYEVLRLIKAILESRIEGDIYDWLEKFFNTVGIFNKVKKTQATKPDLFKQAKDALDVYLKVFTEIVEIASPLQKERIEFFLEKIMPAVRKSEGQAESIDGGEMCNYFRIALALEEWRKTNHNKRVPYGYMIRTKYRNHERRYLLNSLSMLLPGGNVTKDKIDEMKAENPELAEFLYEYFDNLPVEYDDRLSAYKFGMGPSIEDLKKHGISKIYMSISNGIGLAAGKADEVVPQTVNYCDMLLDEGIEPTLLRPFNPASSKKWINLGVWPSQTSPKQLIPNRKLTGLDWTSIRRLDKD